MDNELRELEAALRRELRTPIAAPEGFTKNVMARATEKRPVKRVWLWAAAALFLAMILAGLGTWQANEVEQEQVRARTRQQLRLAIEITNARLEAALARGVKEPLTQATQQIEEARR